MATSFPAACVCSFWEFFLTKNLESVKFSFYIQQFCFALGLTKWWLQSRGVLPNKEVRGLGPHIEFGGKIWGKVCPSSPNKRKNLKSSVTRKTQKLRKSPQYGVISKIQRATFGVFVTLIYLWRQNLRLQQEFQRQISGPSPSTS